MTKEDREELQRVKTFFLERVIDARNASDEFRDRGDYTFSSIMRGMAVEMESHLKFINRLLQDEN